MADSILQFKKECYVCGTTYGLHEHHCLEGNGRRKLSEKYGLKIWLCGRHHNMSDEGVHFNKQLELLIKRDCQKKFEETHSREEWMKIAYRNYLDD